MDRYFKRGYLGSMEKEIKELITKYRIRESSLIRMLEDYEQSKDPNKFIDLKSIELALFFWRTVIKDLTKIAEKK